MTTEKESKYTEGVKLFLSFKKYIQLPPSSSTIHLFLLSRSTELKELSLSLRLHHFLFGLSFQSIQNCQEFFWLSYELGAAYPPGFSDKAVKHY